MDALSNISTSSPYVAALTPAAAPASPSGSEAASSSTADVATGPEPSVRTFFSDFARALLANQANDPTQSIDAALAKNLLSPTLSYVAGGQLYNSAGLLQQFATSQFLSQLEINHGGASGTATDAAQSGTSFFGDTGSQAFLNIVNAYEQQSLLSSLSQFGATQNTSAPVSAGTSSSFEVQPTVASTSTATKAASNTADAPAQAVH